MARGSRDYDRCEHYIVVDRVRVLDLFDFTRFVEHANRKAENNSSRRSVVVVSRETYTVSFMFAASNRRLPEGPHRVHLTSLYR